MNSTYQSTASANPWANVPPEKIIADLKRVMAEMIAAEKKRVEELRAALEKLDNNTLLELRHEIATIMRLRDPFNELTYTPRF